MRVRVGMAATVRHARHFSSSAAKAGNLISTARAEEVIQAHASLGHVPGASQDALKRAFNEAALKLHPDHQQSSSGPEEFLELRTAFDVAREFARADGGYLEAEERDVELTFSASNTDERGRTTEYRKTIPIFFCHGPWHSAWAWSSTQRRLAEKGFVSRAVTTNEVGNLGCLEEEVRCLEQLTSDELVGSSGEGAWHNPPILVGHGAGAFIAQAFAEIHPVSGLVLVAPAPPTPQAFAERLTSQGDHSNVLPIFKEASNNLLLRRQGLYQQLVSAEPSATPLLRDLMVTGLSAEPFVDTLVVGTSNDPLVTEEDLEELMEWHGLTEDELIMVPGAGNHLTMLDPEWERSGGLSDQIVEWIDEAFSY